MVEKLANKLKKYVSFFLVRNTWWKFVNVHCKEEAMPYSEILASRKCIKACFFTDTHSVHLTKVLCMMIVKGFWGPFGPIVENKNVKYSCGIKYMSLFNGSGAVFVSVVVSLFSCLCGPHQSVNAWLAMLDLIIQAWYFSFTCGDAGSCKSWQRNVFDSEL